MKSRFFAVCTLFWSVIARAGCRSAEVSSVVAEFATARARDCQQRMRAAIGLPPLP